MCRLIISPSQFMIIYRISKGEGEDKGEGEGEGKSKGEGR
jgi:hypothetical protein